jgi:hypothetical protein
VSISAVLRKISSVALGLVLLRLIAAAGSIVVLCICPTEELARVGLYLAALNLTSLAAFGRFERLLFRASNEEEFGDSVCLCVTTAAFAIFLLFAILWAYPDLLPGGAPAACFAFGLASRLWLRLGLTFATRSGSYADAVLAMLPHAVIQPVLLIVLLKWQVSPLLSFAVADIVGHAIAAACVSYIERNAFHHARSVKSAFDRVWKLARLNLDLPTTNLTAIASAAMFAMAPLAFLTTMSNSILAGTLALVFKLLDLPAALTANSLTPILLKEVADARHRGSLAKVRAVFLLPVASATLVFGSIAASSLVLQDVMQARWQLALALVPIVALFQASVAAANPLIDVATAAGRQIGIFSINVGCVLTAGGAFLVFNGEPLRALLSAAAIGFLRVVIMTSWLYRREQTATSLAVA